MRKRIKTKTAPVGRTAPIVLLQGLKDTMVYEEEILPEGKKQRISYHQNFIADNLSDFEQLPDRLTPTWLNNNTLQFDPAITNAHRNAINAALAGEVYSRADLVSIITFWDKSKGQYKTYEEAFNVWLNTRK